MLLGSVAPLYAQPGEGGHPSDHGYHGASVGAWEGSAQGVAYSEFNHHLAGLFVLLMADGLYRVDPRPRICRLCSGPGCDGHAGHYSRLVQAAVGRVLPLLARAVSHMGVALGWPDCAHRDAAADVFRVIGPVVVRPLRHN